MFRRGAYDTTDIKKLGTPPSPPRSCKYTSINYYRWLNVFSLLFTAGRLSPFYIKPLYLPSSFDTGTELIHCLLSPLSGRTASKKLYLLNLQALVPILCPNLITGEKVVC